MTDQWFPNCFPPESPIRARHVLDMPMGVPVLRARGVTTPQPEPAVMGRRLVGYGISLLAALGITVAVGDIVGAHYPILMRCGVALCLLAQIVVIVNCLRPNLHRDSRRWLFSISILATGGLLAIVVGLLISPAPWPGLEWRTNIWFGPVLQYFILLHARRRAAWVPFVVIGLAGWTMVTVLHHLDWRIQVLDLVFTLTPMATLGIGGAAITNLLMELRLSQLRRIRGEQETRRSEMQEQERRTRIRLAHDSLLHSLQQLSRGWAQPSMADSQEVARRAMNELRASSQSLDDGTWVELRPALKTALVDQGCTITWRGREATVPAEVSEAIVGAAREAIRNVVKHAGAFATVHVSPTASGCRVNIVDDGAGFDPAQSQNRLGIQESIVARMEEVGGSAVVASSEVGSSVTLEWAPEPLTATEPFGPVARTIISWLPVPVLVASLIHVSVFEVGPNALAVAAIWGGTTMVAGFGMYRLRSHGLAGWLPWVFTALAMVLLVANYSWISPVGTNGYHVWTPSLAGALMVLALPGRKLGHAVGMAAAVIAVTVAASVLSLGWETTLGAQFGSIMAVVMYVLAPLALATGTSILANHSRHTEELAAARRLSTDLAAERNATRRAWITRLQALAEPLLMEVAHGVANPQEPEVMRRAQILESRVRDELSLWPDGIGLADAVHGLRIKGWDCSVNMAVNEERDRGELMAVMTYLPEPIPGQRLHLTHRQSRAVATITDPPLNEEQWQQLPLEAEVVRDEDFTQISTSPTRAHPSRLSRASQ